MKNNHNCSIIVRRYRYPDKALPWRTVRAFGSLKEMTRRMFNCLAETSGSEEYYSEAVMYLNNRLMPGLSNKREEGFPNGEKHWKCLR